MIRNRNIPFIERVKHLPMVHCACQRENVYFCPYLLSYSRRDGQANKFPFCNIPQEREQFRDDLRAYLKLSRNPGQGALTGPKVLRERPGQIVLNKSPGLKY